MAGQTGGALVNCYKKVGARGIVHLVAAYALGDAAGMERKAVACKPENEEGCRKYYRYLAEFHLILRSFLRQPGCPKGTRGFVPPPCGGFTLIGGLVHT